MKNVKRLSLVLMCWILFCSVNVDRAFGQKQNSSKSYTCQKIFTYGLWGYAPVPYELGLEGMVRTMRRHYMNCLVAAPKVTEGASGLARLKRDVALCKKYGIYSLPSGSGGAYRLSPEQLRPVVEALKDEPYILGWYIRDEPFPAFLPEFLECQKLLDEIAPNQPAVCLFYQPDSMEVFAPHQPVMLTDCYPLAYSHDGTSLGPHFLIEEGEYKLTKGMERFNMYDNRGIVEWMDLCRSLCGNMPHWITLGCFEAGNSMRPTRHRDATIAELRLQIYMAIAGGAKGINFFIYNYMVDKYGNGIAILHGEHTPVMEEVKRIGAEITPLGPLLVEADTVEPFTVIATYRPTPDPGDRIEVKQLSVRNRDVDYLVAYNNDLMVRSRADVNLSKSFVGNRKVYDLTTLKPVPTGKTLGAVTVPITLKPGGGRIFTVASKADFQADAEVIIKGRCENEAAIFDMDYDLAKMSNVKLQEVTALRKKYAKAFSAGKYVDALSLIRRCDYNLKLAEKADVDFDTAKQGLDFAKKALGRLKAGRRISEIYRGLLRKFWDGKAHSINKEVALLRKLVEQAEAAKQGAIKLGNSYEQNLKQLEKTLNK